MTSRVASHMAQQAITNLLGGDINVSFFWPSPHQPCENTMSLTHLHICLNLQGLVIACLSHVTSNKQTSQIVLTPVCLESMDQAEDPAVWLTRSEHAAHEGSVPVKWNDMR